MSYSVDSYHAMQERCDRLEIALSARDARIAELERHLEACKAECRAWRNVDQHASAYMLGGPSVDRSWEQQQAIEWKHVAMKARAATDAAGGVA